MPRIAHIAFTAEESGLIGSEKYCKEPIYPLDKTIAMINMDMVGRLKEDKLIIYGTGTVIARMTHEHNLHGGPFEACRRCIAFWAPAEDRGVLVTAGDGRLVGR